MKIGLYPGCSMDGSSREYQESLRAIAPKISLELEDVKEWNCCGASSAHAIDHALSLALPAKILAQAEAQQMKELAVPCAACYNRLASTKVELAEDEAMRMKVAKMVDLPYTGATSVKNILDVLTPLLTPEVVKTFPATFPHKVVCYYGCLLVRPKSVMHHTRMEDPMEMDELMKRIGATPLEWSMKTECCGASFSITRTDIVGTLGMNILEDATMRGAEAIIVACPMCHSNLDMRRTEIEKVSGKKYSIPILYITQAIGLALGCSPQQLGLQRHFVPAKIEAKLKVQQTTPAAAAVS
ncbi:MAG TPA: CoB--CoM heterodisulfide reductase iron-sulfur subunit B family protein [Bacteroidota bacterium]|nr:CoB--CoM heterodisulfide reductase iron-sulfur subunit B family protein [Bacteroidota bacterium]